SNSLIDNAKNLLAEELNLPTDEDLEKLDKRDFYSVSLSNLNYRLDGSYHLPIVNTLIDRMQKCAGSILPLSDNRLTTSIILPPRFKRTYVEAGHGRVLFGGKQIYELDPSNKKYLSLKAHDKLYREQLEIKENTILITRSGTIGKVALTPKHWENWVASDHIIRVVPTSKEIAGYLYIFLDSSYGYYFITKHTYGSVIDEIDDNQVGEIPIPILKDEKKQKEINDLALEANQKRYEAYLCEQEALDIMNKEVLQS
ncbi:MAG: restriction endonuclease subunit S, partial [Lachnospiraceae bacterium]|nr:restriction endonuclease subunit S [Lachnospiraceae bacterium]